jgi:uncharacterized membrane protein
MVIIIIIIVIVIIIIIIIFTFHTTIEIVGDGNQGDKHTNVELTLEAASFPLTLLIGS